MYTMACMPCYKVSVCGGKLDSGLVSLQHVPFTDCTMGLFDPAPPTAGDYLARLMRSYVGQPEGLQELELIRLVNDYFTANPRGTVTFGNYTARGRKRRGLPKGQTRSLRMQVGTGSHYFPSAVYFRGQVRLTQDRATVPCRCRGVNRAYVPLITTIWTRPV